MTLHPRGGFLRSLGGPARQALDSLSDSATSIAMPTSPAVDLGPFDFGRVFIARLALD
jgi:hypothetical protein